jgi:hypothetical protein
MLIVELNLDDRVVLADKDTGQRLADITLASLIHYPTHTAARLGLDAPQSVSITRPHKDKGLRTSHGKQNQRE